jgi:hypothetical protein
LNFPAAAAADNRKKFKNFEPPPPIKSSGYISIRKTSYIFHIHHHH